MRRFIVLNPALESDVAWIQGDIITDSAQSAAESVERNISGATSNVNWEVYPAPAGFPNQDTPYSGGDVGLLAALRNSARPFLVPNGRCEDALALAC